MGLDMYLYRAEKNTADRHEPEFQFCECITCRPKYLWVEEEEIGYWRKANAIHGWFVRNLADGVDECQQIPVNVADLLRLQDDCKVALANKPDVLPSEDDEPAEVVTEVSAETSEQDVAKLLMDIFTVQKYEGEFTAKATEQDPLPPTGGFFFGSTVRDEWYYKDIEQTLDIVEQALSSAQFLDEDESIVYQASW